MGQWLSEEIKLSDAEEAIEYFFTQGWTDGLPIVPPTPSKVRAMLAEMNLEGTEIVGEIPERKCRITSEQVAIHAVMAGCLPAYLPVVLAAVRAVTKPEFGVHGPTASTGGASILAIINGPVVQQLNLNTGKNLMGTGNRANATIGRAIRLVMQNAGRSAEFDQTTIGNPAKFSFCIAEAECDEWLPLHVERGFKREDSAITVFASLGANQVYNPVSDKPEGILMTMADSMSALGTFNMQRDTQYAVVICPEHLAVLVENGWTKQRVKAFLYEHARRKKTDMFKFGLQVNLEPGDESQWMTAVPSPDDILLVAGGGPAGRFSACVPGWGSVKQSRSVTEQIVITGFT